MKSSKKTKLGQIEQLVYTNTQTASYTPVASDALKLIEMSGSSPMDVTINSNVFSAGDTLLVAQEGTGQVSFVAGSGVTIKSAGNKLKINEQYGLGTLLFKTANIAYLSGNLKV